MRLLSASDQVREWGKEQHAGHSLGKRKKKKEKRKGKEREEGRKKKRGKLWPRFGWRYICASDNPTNITVSERKQQNVWHTPIFFYECVVVEGNGTVRAEDRRCMAAAMLLSESAPVDSATVVVTLEPAENNGN
jgi:hypothetical protein